MLGVDLKVDVDGDVDDRGEGQADEDPKVMERQAEVLVGAIDPTLLWLALLSHSCQPLINLALTQAPARTYSPPFPAPLLVMMTPRMAVP